MKIINLVDLEKSQIKYKISKFPDGQQNITLLCKEIDLHKSIGIMGTTSEVKDSITISSRMNNFTDLELIICTVACLREYGVKSISLYVPYFIGARSDRKFEEGGNWYLKQVICPIINSLNFESITVLDAHSNILGNLLNNFKGLNNELLVKWAIENIYEEVR